MLSLGLLHDHLWLTVFQTAVPHCTIHTHTHPHTQREEARAAAAAAGAADAAAAAEHSTEPRGSKLQALARSKLSRTVDRVEVAGDALEAAQEELVAAWDEEGQSSGTGDRRAALQVRRHCACVCVFSTVR